jgi:hypothetical protein
VAAVTLNSTGRYYSGDETRVHVRLETLPGDASPSIAVDIFEKGRGGEHITSDAYPATAAGVKEVNEVLKSDGIRSTVALPKGAGEASDIETFISGPHRFEGLGDICAKCGKVEESWVHAKGARGAGELARVGKVILNIS